MITFKHTGNFKHTERFFTGVLRKKYLTTVLERYGQEGVSALAAATPKDSGKTASSWEYEIEITDSGAAIQWNNTNINNGVNIAVILQYGHGTGTGGYVSGRDYINPAIRPVFDKIANEVWKEVTAL